MRKCGVCEGKLSVYCDQGPKGMVWWLACPKCGWNSDGHVTRKKGSLEEAMQ